MNWRLLWSGYADGYTNMAVDEAMMWAAAEGRVPPTLRLYAWRPAAVSLGYLPAIGLSGMMAITTTTAIPMQSIKPC